MRFSGPMTIQILESKEILILSMKYFPKPKKGMTLKINSCSVRTLQHALHTDRYIHTLTCATNPNIYTPCYFAFVNLINTSSLLLFLMSISLLCGDLQASRNNEYCADKQFHFHFSPRHFFFSFNKPNNLS